MLQHCVERFTERFDELAYALCVEAGKPIKDAEGEVTRLIDTFRIAAEESTRNYGEVQPLDISARAKGYMGMWKRVPIGPCSFISPFNFPLNLAAHKIAPGHRGGLPVRDEAGQPRRRSARSSWAKCWPKPTLPEGAFSILPASRDGADLFTDRRAAEAAQLHRFARGGLGAEGARRARRRSCSNWAAMPR